MLLGRSDRGLLAQWWFTVDRVLMFAILLLMAVGVLVSMAASPPVAERIGADTYHFIKGQIFFLVFAVPLLVTLSFFPPRLARRAGLFVFFLSLALMVAALFFGPEIKGAHRWINIGPIGIQPSEFAKPAFVVVAAWFLAEHTRRPEMPGQVVALLMGAAFIGLLIMQPDFGQTALVVLTFGSMLLIYGISWFTVLGLGALGVTGVLAAYELVPHVRSRIDRFMSPDKGDTFQVDTALQAFKNGGFMGTGPGGGQAKLVLPDAHTDFTFAVVGEEFGLIACLILMTLFAFVVLKILVRARQEPDPFAALALSGLGLIFGFQAVINMGVNTALLPAKGMTLPFISYGGSSLLGLAFGMGLVLALGRRRFGAKAGVLAAQRRLRLTMMARTGTFVLAAGGTGGHLFPAQALAEELTRRGYTIHLMTDERVRDYGKNFPAAETHIVPSATLSLSKPWLVPGRALRLYGGYRAARAILKRVKPLAVIGFGGYPSFPPILAAARLGIPSCVHDQNAVMGRANRVLATWADAVASSFPDLQGLPESARRKLTITGNPVRDVALKERAAPYPAFDGFNLLVFGGSQGAQFFGEFMPKVFAAMTPDQRRGIRLTQQVRKENMEETAKAYQALGLDCELNAFFMDMPKRIAAAHLVVCRSGASTIAELGVIGRPAVMVPLPHALDNDQLRNAESFAAAGAGWVQQQASLQPDRFAQFLTSLRSQQGQLQQAAAAALGHGKPDAAERLADLAETLAGNHKT